MKKRLPKMKMLNQIMSDQNEKKKKLQLLKSFGSTPNPQC